VRSARNHPLHDRKRTSLSSRVRVSPTMGVPKIVSHNGFARSPGTKRSGWRFADYEMLRWPLGYSPDAASQLPDPKGTPVEVSRASQCGKGKIRGLRGEIRRSARYSPAARHFLASLPPLGMVAVLIPVGAMPTVAIWRLTGIGLSQTPRDLHQRQCSAGRAKSLSSKPLWLLLQHSVGNAAFPRGGSKAVIINCGSWRSCVDRSARP
jgi:hypothetical protein